jgi:hypothetical protein
MTQQPLDDAIADADNEHRRRIVIDFVPHTDFACVEPVNTSGTPRDCTFRIGLISQRGDRPTRPDEQVLILAANAG